MDTSDLDVLIRLYGSTVYGFCYSLVKNRTDADDLYQETFLKAMELCYKIDMKNNPKGFLVSIAVRLWKNKSRKYTRRNRIAPFEELNEAANLYITGENNPEDIVITKELRKRVQSAADVLNDKLKLPLYMYYTAGMSHEDIAAALKIPKGTVKSRLFKAREVIKNHLEMEAEAYEEFRTIG